MPLTAQHFIPILSPSKSILQFLHARLHRQSIRSSPRADASSRRRRARRTTHRRVQRLHRVHPIYQRPTTQRLDRRFARRQRALEPSRASSPRRRLLVSPTRLSPPSSVTTPASAPTSTPIPFQNASSSNAPTSSPPRATTSAPPLPRSRTLKISHDDGSDDARSHIPPRVVPRADARDTDDAFDAFDRSIPRVNPRRLSTIDARDGMEHHHHLIGRLRERRFIFCTIASTSYSTRANAIEDAHPDPPSTHPHPHTHGSWTLKTATHHADPRYDTYTLNPRFDVIGHVEPPRARGARGRWPEDGTGLGGRRRPRGRPSRALEIAEIETIDRVESSRVVDRERSFEVVRSTDHRIKGGINRSIESRSFVVDDDDDGDAR